MGSKGPLGMVTKAEWRSRTSLFGRRREGAIAVVDAAYDRYYDVRSSDNADKLADALKDYLKTHSNGTNFWDRVDRNTTSGGLMAAVYQVCFKHGGSSLNAAQAAQKKINEYDIPHSRYGVLYLLANIDIDINIMSTALDGVSAVGGVAGAAASANFGKLSDIQQSSKNAFTVGPTNVSANMLNSSGQGVLAAAKIIKAPNPVSTAGAFEPPSQGFSRPKFPKTLSALQIASVHIGDAYDHNKVFGIAAAAGAVVVAPAILASTVIDDVGTSVAQFGKEVYQKIKTALQAAWKKIEMKMLADGAWSASVMGAIAKQAINFVLSVVIKQAAGYISNGIDVAKGLVKTVDAAATRVASYLNRRKLVINPGHPEEIANTLEKSMTMGVLGGLAGVLTAAAKTTVAVILPGAGFLVSALLSGIEWLVKFMYQLWERSKIKEFLQSARVHFEQERTRALDKKAQTALAATSGETVSLKNAAGQVTRVYYNVKPIGPRPAQLPVQSPPATVLDIHGRNVTGLHSAVLEPNLDPGGIITDTKRFTEFFKSGCDASPLIAALVLNSGICGSLMTFVRLVDDAGEIMGQKDGAGHNSNFKTAEDFFTRLKIHAQKCLKNSGFVFSANAKDSVSINGYLNMAVDKHSSASSHSFGAKALAFLTA